METVKIINGIEIQKIGRNYCITIKEADGIGNREFHSFKTLKAAREFCEHITK